MKVTPTEVTRPEDVITEDSPLVIVCAFTCIVCEGARLSWSFLGGELPSGVMIRTTPVGCATNLEFTQGSSDQSGTYVCLAVMDDGTVAHSVEANVAILVTAVVWVPQRSMTVPREESAIFRCRSSRSATFTSPEQSVKPNHS